MMLCVGSTLCVYVHCAGTGLVYVTSMYTLFAITVNGGILQWSVQSQDRVFGSPAVGPNGTLFITTYGGVVSALDANANGATLWSTICSTSALYTPSLTPSGLVVMGYVLLTPPLAHMTGGGVALCAD